MILRQCFELLNSSKDTFPKLHFFNRRSWSFQPSTSNHFAINIFQQINHFTFSPTVSFFLFNGFSNINIEHRISIFEYTFRPWRCGFNFKNRSFNEFETGLISLVLIKWYFFECFDKLFLHILLTNACRSERLVVIPSNIIQCLIFNSNITSNSYTTLPGLGFQHDRHRFPINNL